MATKKKMLQAAAGAGGGAPEGAWDLSYAYYDDPLAWDVSSATFVRSFSVSAQDTGPNDVFFKPDGTKMYVLGITGDDINEYNLSTAWNVSTASYLQNFSVAAQETSPNAVFFKPDGTKMYITGVSGDDINEYDLSTAWDISSASFLQNSSVASQEPNPRGLYFKPDGSKMYITGSSQSAYEYDLSTAWDVSTLSFLQNFSVAAQETDPNAVRFKPDGTKMYILGNTGDDVNEYDLSTAWDISTSSFAKSFSVSAQETTLRGMFFKPDGSKMYIIGSAGDDVNEYSLGGFSVNAQETSPTGVTFKPEGDKMYIVGSGGEEVNEYDLGQIPPFSVNPQEINPNDVFFKPDGTKMYVLGQTGQDVNEYDLSTAWGASTAVYLQNFSVASQEIYPEGIFFKPDGTKMYFTGQNGDDVNEYNLSTAWDISTSVYSQSFSVASQQTLPTGIFFKPDGTKMYVIGSQGNDDVTEYDLSTPWDISTSVFLQNFSVAAQETNPEDVFFKPDGTKMYVIGIIGDDVNEYDLSTAWDISTSVFLQNFSVAGQDTAPTGLSFKPDGTRMFVIGQQKDSVNEYDLSAAWDVSTAALAVDPELYFDTSTAVFLQSFSVAAEDTNPTGVVFKPDGTKMYMVGTSADRVNEYNLSTAWDISTAVYSQNFSVGAQDTTPQGLSFKPDGTKMYICGAQGDDVNEYDLSTAWDVTTASFLQNFSVNPQEAAPSDLFFKPDGTKMHIIGSSGDEVNEYNLSTAWDISTASFVQNFRVFRSGINSNWAIV